MFELRVVWLYILNKKYIMLFVGFFWFIVIKKLLDVI